MGGIAEAFLEPEEAHGPSTILLQGQSYKNLFTAWHVQD
jgi:hypothetical protein